jgi:hypothetical protein
MNGLLRYNQIQKALSSYRKQQGWTLHGSRFQEIASEVYQSTKKEPIKQVVNNFDIFVENLKGERTPQLPSELTDWSYYFDFDSNVQVEIFPKDLMVNCPQLFGDKYPIDSSLLSYQDHFKEFSDYININRKYHADNYGSMFRFTEPEYDWNEGKYLTTLEINNLLGYEPGMSAFDNEQEVMEAQDEFETEVPSEEPEMIEEPTKKGKKGKAEKPETKKKVEKEDREIKKIYAETEKIKASEKKLSELNKGIKNLDSMLKRKLITKKEYKTYLNKLMGM